jgi:hypothetical protein
MDAGPARSLFESTLIELADPAVILALIGKYAAENRRYDHGMSAAIRNVALTQRTIEGWTAGAYEEFSVSLEGLRRELFAIVLANNTQSVLADECLAAFDKLRDECGRIDDEPRHPDIGSGKPWPLPQRPRQLGSPISATHC